MSIDVEVLGVKWHCTAETCKKTVQKSAKPRNTCISAPSAVAVIYFSTAENLFLMHTYAISKNCDNFELGQVFSEIL